MWRPCLTQLSNVFFSAFAYERARSPAYRPLMLTCLPPSHARLLIAFACSSARLLTAPAMLVCLLPCNARLLIALVCSPARLLTAPAMLACLPPLQVLITAWVLSTANTHRHLAGRKVRRYSTSLSNEVVKCLLKTRRNSHGKTGTVYEARLSCYFSQQCLALSQHFIYSAYVNRLWQNEHLALLFCYCMPSE